MIERRRALQGVGPSLVVALALFSGCASLRPGGGFGDPFALISVLDVSQPANRTYPVVVQAIDGKRPQGAGAANVPMIASFVVRENLTPDRYDFPVTPGEHYVHLTAVLHPADAAGYLGVQQRSADNGLAIGLTLEEGKRYILGARIAGNRIDDWRPALVAVEPIKNYKRPSSETAQGEGDLKSDR